MRTLDRMNSSVNNEKKPYKLILIEVTSPYIASPTQKGNTCANLYACTQNGTACADLYACKQNETACADLYACANLMGGVVTRGLGIGFGELLPSELMEEPVRTPSFISCVARGPNDLYRRR